MFYDHNIENKLNFNKIFIKIFGKKISNNIQEATDLELYLKIKKIWNSLEINAI